MPKAKAKEAENNPLGAALAEIEKRYGKGAVMSLGDGAQSVEVIPTGSFALDGALGIGGIPRGRVTEIYGPEGSGKTTAALQVVANAQRAGGVAAFIDAEHALDPAYAQRIGVNTDVLLVSQPDCGEQALEIADALIRSGGVAVVVVDSVAALVPRAEIEGEMGDSHVGLQARLMSQGLRKLTGSVATTGTSLIFINQLREKIGVYYGNPETTTGGRALKFYASVRLDVRRTETIKHGTESVGNKVRIKVVKNKLAPPFRQADVTILFGVGFDSAGDLLDQAVARGVISKVGNYYDLILGAGDGEGDVLRLADSPGRDKAKAALAARPDLCAGIAAKLGVSVLVPEPYRPAPGERTLTEPDWGSVPGEAASQ